jgi:hypothetical protein
VEHYWRNGGPTCFRWTEKEQPLKKALGVMDLAADKRPESCKMQGDVCVAECLLVL